MDQLQFTLAQVLAEQVHKYTSTTVHGGGGTVYQTGAGVQGSIAPVRSVTHFHEDQDVWLRDVATDREFQINFKDFRLAVRPGHDLALIHDPASGKWERLLNLTTQEQSFGFGQFNPTLIEQYEKEANQGGQGSFVLMIPILNVFFGLMVLYRVLTTPGTLGPFAVEGQGLRKLQAIAWGFAVFLGSNATLASVLDGSYPLAILWAAGTFLAAKKFSRAYTSMWKAVAAVCKTRSDLIDETMSASLQEMNAKHGKS